MQCLTRTGSQASAPVMDDGGPERRPSCLVSPLASCFSFLSSEIWCTFVILSFFCVSSFGIYCCCLYISAVIVLFITICRSYPVLPHSFLSWRPFLALPHSFVNPSPYPALYSYFPTSSIVILPSPTTSIAVLPSPIHSTMPLPSFIPSIATSPPPFPPQCPFIPIFPPS